MSEAQALAEVSKPVTLLQIVQQLVVLPVHAGIARLKSDVFAAVKSARFEVLMKLIPVLQGAISGTETADILRQCGFVSPDRLTLVEWNQLHGLLASAVPPSVLPPDLGGAYDAGELGAIASFRKRFIATGQLPPELEARVTELIGQNVRGPWVYDVEDAQSVADRPGVVEIRFPGGSYRERYDLDRLKHTIGNARCIASDHVPRIQAPPLTLPRGLGGARSDAELTRVREFRATYVDGGTLADDIRTTLGAKIDANVRHELWVDPITCILSATFYDSERCIDVEWMDGDGRYRGDSISL